jgi:hypothetical protein
MQRLAFPHRLVEGMTHTFAIQRHDVARGQSSQGTSPGHEAATKGLGIKHTKDTVEGIVRRNAPAEIEDPAQKRVFRMPKRFNLREVLRSTEHGTERDKEDIDQGMIIRAQLTRVGEIRKMLLEDGNRTEAQLLAPSEKSSPALRHAPRHHITSLR